MQIWAVTYGPLRQFYRYIVVFKYSAACLLCQERSLTPSLGQGSPFSPFRHGPRLIITTCIFQTVTCIDILGRFGPRSCNVRLLWRYWVRSMMALFECLRMCCAHNVVARCSSLELWLPLSIPVMSFLILPVGVSKGKQLFILGVV